MRKIALLALPLFLSACGLAPPSSTPPPGCDDVCGDIPPTDLQDGGLRRYADLPGSIKLARHMRQLSIAIATALLAGCGIVPEMPDAAPPSVNCDKGGIEQYIADGHDALLKNAVCLSPYRIEFDIIHRAGVTAYYINNRLVRYDVKGAGDCHNQPPAPNVGFSDCRYSDWIPIPYF